MAINIRRLPLLARIIIAIAAGTLIGLTAPDVLVRVMNTFCSVFSQLLGFMIPLIIVGIFDICRAMFPEARIFSITKSQAVIKMNTRLGFRDVPYTELTADPKFWKGCETCPHYPTLLKNNMEDSECQGLLFDPSNPNF